ncbi:MAG: CvpA family protein [Clostridia bacterium]|nr:CvpA family protein [Clostridia bacterium]
MSLFLDALLVAVAVWCIVYGYRNGFFRSVMNLASGVLSLLVSYTFTPLLAELLKTKIFLHSIASGITATFASAAQTVVAETEETVYDLGRMVENEQIISVAEHYGVGREAFEELVNSAEASTYGAIERIALTVADRVASTISMACAFIIIFVAATVLLKVFTAIISTVFKMPVLRNMDTLMGTVAGAAAAFLFAWVISVSCQVLLPALVTIAPGVVTDSTFSNTVIIKFFAENSLVDIFSGMLG